MCDIEALMYKFTCFFIFLHLFQGHFNGLILFPCTPSQFNAANSIYNVGTISLKILFWHLVYKKVWHNKGVPPW